MLNALDLIADGCHDSQLLFQLAPQRITRLFALFNLTPGKFPLQRHGLMPRALAHQKLAVFFDQACDYAFHGEGNYSCGLEVGVEISLEVGCEGSSKEAVCTALATGSIQLVKVNANAATPGEQRSSNSWLP